MFNFLKKTNLKKINRNIHTLKYTNNIEKVLNTSCLNFIEKIYNNNIQDYHKTMKIRDNVNDYFSLG